MTYVDIAWPCGVTFMSLYAYYNSDGYSPRVIFYTFCYFMVGFRMFAGGLFAFYPFRFKEDLGRYRYAKTKWVKEHPADGESTWWIKIQQDTFTQCIANMFTLCIPLFVVTHNKTPHLHWMEIVGVFMWMNCFYFESKADLQKDNFVKNCMKQKRKIQGKRKAEELTVDEKKKIDDLKLACLGHAPFDTKEYSMWTYCRHPNYFNQWAQWIWICFGSLPSIYNDEENDIFVKGVLFLSLYFVVRFFYDC